MKNTLLFLTILCFQFLFSQVTRNVGDINSLKVQGKINVILIQSSYDRVEISGNNSSNVDIINKNGELKLHLKAKKLLLSESITAKVFYQKLNSLQAGGGAIIRNENSMNVKNIKLSSNGSSLIDLIINVDELTAKASYGGKIHLKGSSNNQNVIVNYGGKYEGKELKTINANIKANSKGIAEIFVTKILKARSRTGSSIIVHGNPDNRKDRKTSLGGDILFLR